jgi:hypothetical protein
LRTDFVCPEAAVTQVANNGQRESAGPSQREGQSGHLKLDQDFGVAKWLANSLDWMKITQMSSNGQFDDLNGRSKGKSRFLSIPAFHLPARRSDFECSCRRRGREDSLPF